MFKPEGILFDLGATILNYSRFDPQYGIKALLEIAKNPDNISYDELYRESEILLKELVHEREISNIEINCQSFQRLLYEGLNLSFDIPYDETEKIFHDNAVINYVEPGAAEMLSEFKKLGIPMGIVSNSVFTGKTLEDSLEEFKLLQYFEFLVSSCDYCVRKPHVSIFRLAAKKLGVDSSKIYFIGDKMEYDGIGAAEAGMMPVWYNPEEKENQTDIETYIEINHWDRLVDLIKENN